MNDLQNLTKFNRGDKVKIVKINAGKRATQRLLSIGIVPGNVVEIKRVSALKGPVLIDYQGSEVAIGFGIASKVIGEKVE